MTDIAGLGKTTRNKPAKVKPCSYFSVIMRSGEGRDSAVLQNVKCVLPFGEGHIIGQFISPAESIQEAVLFCWSVISAVPSSAHPATLWCQHADVITHCPPSMSRAIVSEIPCRVCIMYDSMFSRSASVVGARRRRVRFGNARLERPEDVRTRKAGWSVRHAAASHGTALMYPPARQQYAVHSAVIQSFAPERQMVSPVIRLIHSLGMQKVWVFGMMHTET